MLPIFVILSLIFTAPDFALGQELQLQHLEELNQMALQLRELSSEQRNELNLKSNFYIFQEHSLLSSQLSARRPDIRTFYILDKSARKSIGFVVLNDHSGLVQLEQDQKSWIFHAPIGRSLRPEPTRARGRSSICQMESEERVGNMPREKSIQNQELDGNLLFSYGAQLRKYRLAIVATYEYFSFFSDYQTAELELIASVMGVSQSYRKEFAVDFELSDYFIHLNEADGIDPASDRLLEAQQAVTAQFDVADFDIGHVFHWENAGGVANGGVVCIDDWKARGWTSNIDASVANVFWRQTLLHEFGHQFGASHTMDGTAGSCAVGRHGPAAYEPMSGSTTMSYYGGCLNQNVSFPETRGFHVHSRHEVFNFTHFGAGNTCPTIINTDNLPPVADAQPLGLEMATIPVNTPFILTGSGYDPDGEDVLFSWEQYDKTELLIPAADTTPNAFDPNAPLFRNFFFTETPIRVFPRMETVLDNAWPNIDEALPLVGRTMNFRLTAKGQNENGGGAAVAGLTATVDGNTGPFLTLAPNGGESLLVGANLEIYWDPAGTATYSPTVDIRLSTDGGLSFPYVLAEDSPNDGQLTLTIPENVPSSSQARLMVISGQTSSLQFFDVSDADFSIASDCAISPLGYIGGPQTTIIDNPAAIVDPDLRYLGFPADSHVFDIPDDGSGSRALMTGYDEDRIACETRFQEDYEDIFLQVDRSGLYFFQIAAGQCHGYITLFDEALFDENDPCAGFLTSNSFGGFWYCDFTAQLEPEKLYRLRAYDVLGGLGEVLFFPREGGNIYLSDPSQEPQLDWVAVDSENNKIAAYSTTGVFSDLLPGRYFIYGIRFASTISLDLLFEKTFWDLQTEGFCLEWTDNYKILEIRNVFGVCQSDTIEIDDFSILSADTILAGQVITAFASAAPDRDILLQAGEEVILQPGFDAGGTLAARIKDCEEESPGFAMSNILKFDGVDDEVVSVGSTALYCSDFTIETWVKMEELPVFNADFFIEIGDSGSDKWLWFTGVNENGFGNVITGFRNGGIFQDFAFAFFPKAGEWTHLAVTYSNAFGEASFYINGYLQGTQMTNVSPGNEGLPRVTLGRQISGGVANHHFSGALEEVRFWGQCRSGDEIRQYMRRELTGNETALLAYYSFNSPPTNCIDVLDCSSNALHGMREGSLGLYNLPLYEDVVGPLHFLSSDCNEASDPCNSAIDR